MHICMWFMNYACMHLLIIYMVCVYMHTYKCYVCGLYMQACTFMIYMLLLCMHIFWYILCIHSCIPMCLYTYRSKYKEGSYWARALFKIFNHNKEIKWLDCNICRRTKLGERIRKCVTLDQLSGSVLHLLLHVMMAAKCWLINS